MNPLDLTREEAQALLAPQCQYTDAEHTRAWHRFVMECVHDRLSDIVFDIEDGKTTLEEVGKTLNALLYPDTDEDWALQTLWSRHYWNPENFRRIAESERHCGDCTAIPASCMRCYVDNFYDADTRNWETKSQGSAILRRAHGDRP